LSDAELARLEAMVEAVLAAQDQEGSAFRFISELNDDGQTRLVCALFESLYWRIDIRYYWSFYTVMLCYRQLRKFEAAYLLAAMTSKIDPISSGEVLTSEVLFGHFMRKGARRDAWAVFQRHNELRPEHLFVSHAQVASLQAEFGSASVPGPVSGEEPAQALRRRIRVVEPSTREAMNVRIYGRFVPHMLEFYRRPGARPSIDVVVLENGQALIRNDGVIVLDASGWLDEDLSVHEFPTVLYQAFGNLDQSVIEQINVDDAVVISDRFPIINVAHNMFDHMTRLDLYARAGVDITAATVIGPPLHAEFQRSLAEKFGIVNFVSTNRTARVVAKRLWVSSNCRNLLHPGHDAMPWALQSLRSRLGGANQPGANRLYISRRDATARRVTNEAEVMSLLSGYGFRILVLSEYTFDHQISAFANAMAVVGPHGAGMYQVVVCGPGTAVLEIFHPLCTPPGVAMLASRNELNYSALIGYDGRDNHPDFNDPHEQDPTVSYHGRDIRVDLQDLRSWLDDTFGKRN
jgi:capsular polysaccharide biosynthesis protein